MTPKEREETTESPHLYSIPIIFLVGPTAIGKTDLSLEIARTYNCEIIGMDSMQIYKHMDIGTAKPTPEERSIVPHHLIDYVDPAEKYNAGRFIHDATDAVCRIWKKGKLPLLTGGTGLYMKSLLEGLFDEDDSSAEEEVRLRLQKLAKEKGNDFIYRQVCRIDPESAQRIHPNDTFRLIRALEIRETHGITWSELIKTQNEKKRPQNRFEKVLKIGLTLEREILYERINKRVEIMLEKGFIREVENLLQMGYSPHLKPMQSIGYKHMVKYLAGQWTLPKAKELMARDTRHYAKRQFTWFGKDAEIKWFAPEEKGKILETVTEFLT